MPNLPSIDKAHTRARFSAFSANERKKIAWMVHRVRVLTLVVQNQTELGLIDTYEKQELGCLRWVLEELEAMEHG